MGTITEFKDLSKNEKLMIMEALWEDLSQDDDQVVSPGWHKKTLNETAKRLKSGEEQVIDWAEAKKELRKHLDND